MPNIEIKRVWRNNSKSSTIGLPPGTKHPDHGQPWQLPSHGVGGSWLYIPPGGTLDDSSGFINIMVAHGKIGRIFVHCEDEAELLSLQEKSPDIAVVRDGQKLKGFWNPMHVLEDVTEIAKETFGMNMINASEHIANLRREADEGRAALSELEKLRAEHEALRRSADKLKKELVSSKSPVK